MKRLPHLLAILAGLLLLAVTPHLAHAAKTSSSIPSASAVDDAPPPVARLSDADRADIERITAYFNALPTVAADFTEAAERPDGGKGVAEGTFKLWRPGRMRIDYKNTTGDFVVADGRTIHFWDGELKQESRTGVDDTLAGVLLQPDFSLTRDVTVVKMKRPSPTKLEVTLRSAKDPAAGELVLLMNDAPLELTGWRVLDGQGLFTEVQLSNVKVGGKFDKADFKFVKPQITKRQR